jgi:hypothetical protein
VTAQKPPFTVVYQQLQGSQSSVSLLQDLAGINMSVVSGASTCVHSRNFQKGYPNGKGFNRYRKRPMTGFVCFNHMYSTITDHDICYISTAPQIPITSSFSAPWQSHESCTLCNLWVLSHPPAADSLPGSSNTLTSLACLLVPLLKTN